jgi:hypothetical protein
MASRILAGNSVAVTDSSAPGAQIYAAPTTAGVVVRCLVYATNVGGTLRSFTLEHDRGASHPTATGIVDVVDNLTLALEGYQQAVADVVLYGHASDPDALDAFVSAGTVNFTVIAMELL